MTDFKFIKRAEIGIEGTADYYYATENTNISHVIVLYSFIRTVQFCLVL